MKIAFVDNDSTDMTSLLSLLIPQLKENFSSITYDKYTSGEGFLSKFYLGKYDFVFLDIFMNELTGIDVAKEIRQLDNNVQIIFSTSSNDFASESYMVEAFYYLVKPFTEENVNNLVRKISSVDFTFMQFITLKNGQRIFPRNIIYTEYSNHKITIHQKDKTDVGIRMSQSQWEDIICEFPYIVSCFKGIVVNLYEVTKKEDNYFCMSNSENIPISRRKIKEISNLYSDFLFKKLRKDVSE